MPEESGPSKAPVDWAVAGLALGGQAESGDLHFVSQAADEVLLGLVDGLGHGPEAALAARSAVAALESGPGQPLVERFERCHTELKRTRGVVMSLASIDVPARTLSWVGIGNIECVLVRAGGAGTRLESIMLLGGVVGHQLPRMRASQVAIEAGDVLVMATDGIRGGFRSDLSTIETPQKLAERVLRRHGREIDDALVLVARFDPGT